MNIETELHKGAMGRPDFYIVKVALDDSFYEKISSGNYRELGGLANLIAEKIAEKILPEMEQRVFADPAFKDRVIGDILVRIANRLADKGFLEKESEDKK